MGTISKALNLLDEFSVERPEIGLSEFYRRVGRDKATVHRHLAELESLGFVERTPRTRAYRLGPAVLRLATIRETCFPIQAAVAPAVDAAAADLGELVHFALCQGQSLIQIHHSDPHAHGTAVYFDPGALAPLHCTSSGLSVLAFGPETLRDAILAQPLEVFTDTSPKTADELLVRIEATRRRGYALSDGTYDPDVVSVAVPVFGQAPCACGAVAAAFPAPRASAAARIRALDRLQPLARTVSEALGGRFPSDLVPQDS